MSRYGIFRCHTRPSRQGAGFLREISRDRTGILYPWVITSNVLRNSLNEVASTFTVEDIYGERKAEFLTKVQVMIQSKVIPVGVGIQQFGFIGAARAPDVIATSITAKARAIQEAERARNELETMQAKAAKKIAEALKAMRSRPSIGRRVRRS